MRRHNALVLDLVPALLIATTWILATSAAPLRAQSEERVISVKGSNTVGGKLGQSLAQGFIAFHPGVDIDWESLGSGTAFVGLFDGSADLGASSRPIKTKELQQARDLGLVLREYVIGYDGIAVIVHPTIRSHP